MNHFEALISRRHGGYYYAINDDLREIPCRLRGNLKKNTDSRNLAVVGDRVSVSLLPDGTEGTINEILPRKSFVRRAKGYQRKYGQREEKQGQILIANVDQVVILLSAREPDFHPLLLDRFLIMVEAMELTPIVFINKCDLTTENEVEDFLSDYRQSGYQILPISVSSGLNMEKVKGLLDGKISFITGPSGAGKSSLALSLNPELNVQIGVWSERCKTGPQTTSATALHPLWKNTFLADTAGFSQIFLFHISRFVLREYYPEFRQLPPCTYSDCLHDGDEGCLVEKYARKGLLPLQRLERYRKLLGECNRIFPEYHIAPEK
jgi:ribosome biogenesis GTPase